MKGDFSNLKFNPRKNYSGVLHQQGRVLLDQDWNDAQQIANYLRELQGRDVIGPNVAAVPSELRNSFKVIKASTDGSTVDIDHKSGRIWVDGKVVQYGSRDSSGYGRRAEYFAPPIQVPQADASTIAEGVRDAVIIEVWEEEVNGFQDPLNLIEPALGGIDTTERLRHYFRFRLLRLAPGDDCGNLADRLVDDFGSKGRLTVSATATEIAGDCPVEVGGGYTGFEHYSMRIEIAEPDSNGDARFKWSRFNGGLVGRGIYNSDTDKVDIKANDQMINHCGRSNFHFEVLRPRYKGESWLVVFSAKATLSDNGELSLTNIEGTWPGSGEAFFRLWDGIKPIKEYQTGLPDNQRVLEMGVQLEFDLPTTGNANYTPGDYWTFPLRAEGTNYDPEKVWPSNDSPQGIHYHRAPLAILEWQAAPPTSITYPAAIRDCRHVFQPLTRLDTCCKVTVGDGRHSQGDYSSIEQAITNLPPNGGIICVLAGVHHTNAILDGKQNIVIRGCGKNSKVLPRPEDPDSPIFMVKDSVSIVLEHMDLATPEGTAIHIEGSELGDLSDITVRHNRILAYEQAIHVSRGIKVRIHNNAIRQLDKEFADVAIYMMAEDCAIERNEVLVIPAEETPALDEPDDGPGFDPVDPCARFDNFYRYPMLTLAYWNRVWGVAIDTLALSPYTALGGIQIGGGSERIKIGDNKLKGGAGNGITLGSFMDSYDFPPGGGGEDQEFFVKSIYPGYITGFVKDAEGNGIEGIELSFVDDAGNATPDVTNDDGGYFVGVPEGTYQIIVTTPGYRIDNIDSVTYGSIKVYLVTLVESQDDVPDDDPFAFIYDIDITDNEILDMGLNGIGGPQLKNLQSILLNTPQVAAYKTGNYFAAREYRYNAGLIWIIGALLSSLVVGLRIQRNHIHNCVNNPFDGAMRTQALALGYGGIILRFSEAVLIEHNRIEDNGVSHIDPVCGILAIGSNITITDNQILNNGPLLLELIETPMAAGTRSGIFLFAFSMPLTSIISTLTGEQSPLELLLFHDSLPAACIQDNIVYQPAGPALVAFSMGALAVLNNKLSTELSAASGFFDANGTVVILSFDLPNLSGTGNLSRVARMRVASDGGGLTSTAAAAGNEGGLSVLEGNVLVNRWTTGGTVLFNNNQIRLGVARDCSACQMLIGTGDISFASNQSTVDAYDENLIFNSAISAQTIRACNNRLMELRRILAIQAAAGDGQGLVRVRRAVVVDYEVADSSRINVHRGIMTTATAELLPISLFTNANAFNNTSNNQGDHCIIALPAPGETSPTVAEGNQMLNVDGCAAFGVLLDQKWRMTQTVLNLLR